MNTLLPYPNFIGSAKVLDVRRLGKQRVETLQIMQALLGKRVANTAQPEPTGVFRTLYFDRYQQEVPLEELDTFDVWCQEKVPVMRLVATPKTVWRIEDHDPGRLRNDPAVLMWRGYEHALMQYQGDICEEWTDRGFKDTCQEKTAFLYQNVRPLTVDGIPPWIGDEDFHRSHQSNLLRMHPKYYEQFFHDVPSDLPYLWPVTV